jgi:hypothetical protein
MRFFDRAIFMGAGIFSEADCRLLKKQLDDALSALSGIQQGGREDAIRDGWDTREDAVRDIAAALLGKTVVLGPDYDTDAPSEYDNAGRAAGTGRRQREVHQRWRDAHERVMRRCGLPCKLRITPDVKIGRHRTEDDGCVIEVNDYLDFDTPEHLILHEAAHHEARERDECFDSAEAVTCVLGHCKHWARTLCEMYDRVGVDLPEGTKFEAFAKEAGILHREYLPPDQREKQNA